MIKKRIKYMSLTVPVPNACAANTVTPGNFKPDKDYKMITGVRAFIGEPGSVQGGTFVLLSLIDSKGVIHDPSHSNGWIPSQDCNMNDRWKEITIPIDGSIIQCLVKNGTLSTATYDIIFEFRLEDELVQIANVN
jgi:hypothetical protein